MTSRKRQCPRRARMHRHCLDSLEIPFTHPSIFPPPPACHIPPSCQVSPTNQTQPRVCRTAPPACQLSPPNCQDLDLACQDRPFACQLEHPTCHNTLPACPVSLAQEPPPASQIRPPICQVRPPACQGPAPSCLFQPFACQGGSHPACQLPSTTCKNWPRCTMKQPIHQWDQEFCTTETCHDSTNCTHSSTGFCQLSIDEDDIIKYSGGGGKNLEENDPPSRGRCNNNQKDKSCNEDEYNTCVSQSNTPSRTNHNANTTSSNRNDEENMFQAQNLPHNFTHKEWIAAGPANREMIINADNINNDPAQTNFLNTQGFSTCGEYPDRNEMSNNFNRIPVSNEHSPQFTDNVDSSNVWETIPCETEYFQDQALQLNSLENNEYFQRRQEFSDEQSCSKTDGCKDCCGSSYNKMNAYQTEHYTDNNDGHQGYQTETSGGTSQRQREQFYTDENFNNIDNAARKEIGPRIAASPCSRSALKSPSMHPRSGTKVKMLTSNGNSVNPRLINDLNNPHGYISQSQTCNSSRTALSTFENSVPTTGAKQIANCCKHGISKALEPVTDSKTKNAECYEKIACAQEVGTSSCSSTTCVANTTAPGCGCRYPPAFRQFSCAGNINGTCSCVDKNKT